MLHVHKIIQYFSFFFLKSGLFSLACFQGLSTLLQMVGSSALNQNSCIVLIYTYVQMHMWHLCIHMDIYEHVFVYWLLKNPFDWYFWFCYKIGQETRQSLPYTPLHRIWHIHRVTGPTFALRDSSAMRPLLYPTGTLQPGRRSVTYAQTSCSEQQDKMILRWSVRSQDSPPGRLCVTGNAMELSILGGRTVFLCLSLSVVREALLSFGDLFRDSQGSLTLQVVPNPTHSDLSYLWSNLIYELGTVRDQQQKLIIKQHNHKVLWG